MLIFRRMLLCLIGGLFAVSCGNSATFENATTDKPPNLKSKTPLDADATRGNTSDQEAGDGILGDNSGQSPDDDALSSSDSGTMKEVEMSFKAASLVDARLTFDQEYLEFAHTVVRENNPETRSATYEQLTRNQFTKTVRQGSDGKQAEEIFTQSQLGIIDILVVVDNSGSMEQEHNKIKEKLPDLTSKVSGSNWQIRIVSTDEADACNQFSIVNESSKADFQRHIDALGTEGSGLERGVFKAIKGLNCANDPWVRNGSNLAVLIVSDEDNCSRSCESELENTPAELKELMSSAIGNSQTTRQLGVDARVYGIYHKPGEECVSAANEADEYHSLITDTFGYAGSICDENYDLTFQTISQDMRNQLKSTFQLANVPVAGSLDLYLKSSENGSYALLELGVDYKLTEKTIEFFQAPVANASIKANYLYDSTPKFNEIELGLVPGLIEQVKISLDNGDVGELSSDKYSLSGSKLVFAEEPPDNSEVMVSYRDNTPALETRFPLSENATEESIVAKVNGKAMGFSLLDNAVVFEQTPLDGASIEISYEVPRIGDILNKIKTELSVDSVSELKAWDMESGDAMDISLEPGNFILDAQRLHEGQNIKVKLRLSGAGDNLTYNLPFKPIPGSLEVYLVGLDDDRVECLDDDVSISDKIVSLSCNIDELSYVDLSFQHLHGGVQKFKTDFANPDKAVWTVLVNGQEEPSFIRAGSIIGLKDLPANATVIIKARFPSKKADDGNEGSHGSVAI